MDRIIISGDGSDAPPLPRATTYEAENATLAGTVTPPYCEYCSGAGEAGNIGGGSGNTVTFTNVVVPTSGTYMMEIDYLTSGLRSFFLSVNGGVNTELDLNGSSFSLPTIAVITVNLQAGSNTIEFGNDTGYAPALDRIAIAAPVESATLMGAVVGKSATDGLRVWKVTISNSGPGRAARPEINTFSLTQASGVGSCHPRVIARLPLELSDIAAGGHADVEVPIDFSRCSKGARFSVGLVFSANNGADVGDLVGSSEPQ